MQFSSGFSGHSRLSGRNPFLFAGQLQPFPKDPFFWETRVKGVKGLISSTIMVITIANMHFTGYGLVMIVYYVSGHGYGHAVRSCRVIKKLPAYIPITICSSIPKSFFSRELNTRSFQFRSAEFDCGVLGPDSTRINLEQTISRAEELSFCNDDLEPSEIDWLKQKQARLVVADIVPFALRVAAGAGIRSILLANFTWSGIYKHLLARDDVSNELHQRMRVVLDTLEKDESRGDLLLVVSMDLPMEACRMQEKVPIIARRGISCRKELIKVLGLDLARPTYLLYLGANGFGRIDWSFIQKLDGIQLLSYHPPPGTEDHVIAVDADRFDHADVTASVNAVIAKPGYNACGECIAANTPLLYPPREGFAETKAIERTLREWGGALRIESEKFRCLEWLPYLDRLKHLEFRRGKISCDGAAICAEAIMSYYYGRAT